MKYKYKEGNHSRKLQLLVQCVRQPMCKNSDSDICSEQSNRKSNQSILTVSFVLLVLTTESVGQTVLLTLTVSMMGGKSGSDG